MRSSTYFVQECPTCGRRLQILARYLGKSVVCQHCRGRLLARDPSSIRRTDLTAADALLRRADELLSSSSDSLETGIRAGRPR
jgi:DNA-directed RNA polymerase subunit RPC12/RpoP